MTLANGVRFIWLDAYIGQEGEYEGFKRLFRTALDPTATMPPDAIDSLIRALNENVAPFLFADNCDAAMELIEFHRDKKIFFISSGSLGKTIIPTIVRRYPQVHRFYFFCAIIENYVDFAMDYLGCLIIFDFELDLLVRLARDISNDIISQGKEYLNNLNEPKNALKCFQAARTLNITANTLDRLNSSFYEHLRMLEGENGLIRQAENMLDPQRPPDENEEQVQTTEVDDNADDDDDTQLPVQVSSD